MSNQPILYCPHCNHVCKSLHGLAQHTTHRPVCWQKAHPSYLVGLNKPNAPFHQPFVVLDAPHADESMEPIWQQIDDSPTAFEPPDLGVDAATIEWKQQLCVDAAILDAVYLHQNQLDDKVSQQLSSNVLVHGHTMLDAEDRQDTMLDTDESFAYQEDEESIIETANLTIVLDDLPSIKPPKPPPTPPSVAIPPNMSCNASLPRQQQTQMGWELSSGINACQPKKDLT